MLTGGFWEYIILKLPNCNGELSHIKPKILNSVVVNMFTGISIQSLKMNARRAFLLKSSCNSQIFR
jgi:hypothetical protein